jgi:MSHA biogenesis protein MshM
MSMYLEHFGLKESPFSLTPTTGFFCKLPGHQEALNMVLFALKAGDGLIKVTGEVGIGKTLLCKSLINHLHTDLKDFDVHYIANPDIAAEGLRQSLAIEFDVADKSAYAQHELLHQVAQRLDKLRKEQRKMVLILDEAQILSFESLETIRLLSNVETESNKTLYIVLFAQPELDARLQENSLRQLTQRITFSYRIPRISERDLDSYICHRLVAAGHHNGLLFSDAAKKVLLKASQGVPRVINILCHKAMLVAYGQGSKTIDVKGIKGAVADSQEIVATCAHNNYWFKVPSPMLLSIVSVCCLFPIFIHYIARL